MINLNKNILNDFLDSYGDGIHGTPEYDDNGEYYFINGNNLEENGIKITTDTLKVSKEEYERIKRPITDNALLLSINGTLGKLAFYNGEKIALGKSACFLNVKNNVDRRYIKYVLSTNEFQKYMLRVASGSTIKNFAPKQAAEYEFFAPDLPTQKKIADVLSCIDDKIALNNKTNIELENMAKTVYDYWFTQFDFPDANCNPYKTSGGKMEYNQVLKREIPAGWEVGKLSKVADIFNGSTPSTKEEDNYGGNIVWITPKDLSDQQRKFTWYGERNITEKGYKDCNTTLIPEGSILLSSRAPIGLISIATCELCTNQGFKNIVPKNMENKYYLYSVINANIPKIEQLGSGTTFKEVSKQSMEDFKILIPSEQTIKLFNEKIESIFENQLKLLKEIDELTKLRDYLLPLLMNGQINIKLKG